jgi:hypothetical protein
MVTFLPRRRGPAATSIPYREQISITFYMPLTVIAYPERQLLRTLLAVLAHTECELGAIANHALVNRDWDPAHRVQHGMFYALSGHVFPVFVVSPCIPPVVVSNLAGGSPGAPSNIQVTPRAPFSGVFSTQMRIP